MAGKGVFVLVIVIVLNNASAIQKNDIRSPESLSDLKLRIQERRNEALCKYCIKSLIRMKSNICKRCIRTKPKLPLKTSDKPISKPKNIDTNTISQSLKNKLSALDISNKSNKIPKQKQILLKQELKPLKTKELIELLKKRMEENKLNKIQQSGIVQMKNPQQFNDERKQMNDSDSRTETNFITSLVTQAMKSDQTHNLPKGTTISELLKENLINQETAEENSNTLANEIVSNPEMDITPTMSLKDLQLISTKLKNSNALPADKDGTNSKNIRAKRLKIPQEHNNENCDASYPEYADLQSHSQEYCDEPEQQYHLLRLAMNTPNQYSKSPTNEEFKFSPPNPTIATQNTGSTFGDNFRDVFTELFEPNPTILNQINNNNNIDTNDDNFKENLSKLHNKLHDISSENNNGSDEQKSDVDENIQAILSQHGLNWEEFNKYILEDNSNTDPFYQDILDKLSDVLYANDNSITSTNSDMNNELLQSTNDPYLSTSNKYQSSKSTRSVDGKRSTVLDNENANQWTKSVMHNPILTLLHQKPYYNILDENPDSDNEDLEKNLDNQNSIRTTLPNLGLNDEILPNDSDLNVENNSTPNKQTESPEEVSKSNMFKHIKNQHFLNRMTYMKHPRLKSTYDGNHILMAVSEHPVYTKHKLSIFDESITTENHIDLNAVTKRTFEQTNFPTESPVTNRISMKGNTHDNEVNNGKDLHIIQSIMIEQTTENNVDALMDHLASDNETIKKQNITNNADKEIAYNRNNSKNKPADAINSTELNVAIVSHNSIKNIHPTLSEPTNTNTDLFLKNINMHPVINNNKYDDVLPLLKKSQNPYLGSAKQNIPIINNEGNYFERQTPKNNFAILALKNALETGQFVTPNNTNVLSDHIRFSQNKINLPLVLKQNNDGTFQLIMDQSRICDCAHCNCTNCHNFEKNTLENSTPYSNMQQKRKAIFKRKTDDSKLNMFNVIGKAQDYSKTQINNMLHSDSQEAYYKNLINEKLFEFFDSLNIPVKNVKQLQTYIDNLPNKEKDELEKYILNQIVYTNKLNNKQKITKNHIWETKAKESEISNNRINFNNQRHANDLESNAKLLKTFIQNEIINILQQSNVCTLCKNSNCIHKNHQHEFNDSNEHESKILHKRHENYLKDDSSNEYSDDIKPHGLIKQKYKIVNNLLNWARDMFVNDTKHSNKFNSI